METMKGHLGLMDTSHVKTKYYGLQYGELSNSQRLDIYLPNEGKSPFPVIMSIHGGAFMFGDKDDIQNQSMLKGIERGYAVVCLEYRKSGEAIFPALVHDAKRAIRYLRANRKIYGLDTDKIAVWGGSAGGWLASMLGATSKTTYFDERDSYSNYSADVQAVISWYGPCGNFLIMDDELRANDVSAEFADHSLPNSPEAKLLGNTITLIPRLVEKASPCTYIHKDVPPFYIQHGLRDKIVPHQQSVLLTETIVKAAGKDRATIELVEHAHHADSWFDSSENVNKVLDFIDSVLK